MTHSHGGLLVIQLDTPAAELWVGGQRVATHARAVKVYVEPGDYWVMIHNGSGKRLRRRVTVREGQQATFAMELPPDWLRRRLPLTGRRS